MSLSKDHDCFRFYANQSNLNGLDLVEAMDENIKQESRVSLSQILLFIGTGTLFILSICGVIAAYYL